MSLNDNSAPSGGEAGEPLGSGKVHSRVCRGCGQEFHQPGNGSGRRRETCLKCIRGFRRPPKPAHFTRGFVRADGFRFRSWKWKNGKWAPQWYSPEADDRASEYIRDYVKSDKTPYVYLCVEVGDHSAVKIGVTASLERRLMALQNGNKRPLEFAYLRQFDTEALAYNAEQALHRLFRDHRLSSEWHAISVSEARTALDSLTTEHLPKEPLL